jgi:hypothetical protein
MELCPLSPTPAAAAKRKFSASQRFEIPRCVTQIGPAAERRNGGPADPKTLSSREPQRRRKLAVVSI